MLVREVTFYLHLQSSRIPDAVPLLSSEMSYTAIKTIAYAHDDDRTKKKRRLLNTKSKPQPVSSLVCV
jgi:hypothetical protein